MASPETPPSRFPYGISIALSAFLVFQVQPMVAKAILPWFGGSSAVWTTCLLFFQAALLLGYLYAHVLTRFCRPKAQAWTHLLLLAAALAMLPIHPSARWKPGGSEEPALRILGLLAVSIGLPYVLLSATSPLLQDWYVRRRPEGLPWRFFALSNLGSLAALLTYPFAVEPFVGVRRQLGAWSAGFVVFAVVCGVVAWKRGRVADAVPGKVPGRPVLPPPRGDVALWVLLSACASALLLAVTSHLTQNVASVPFLWVVPLSLYLATFILCFEGRNWYRRGIFVPLLILGVGSMTLLLGPELASTTIWIVLPVFAAGLFACCMTCHGELAKLKPDPAHLTLFYLCISAGGALGGLLVGLVAPRVFNGTWELPLGLTACLGLTLFAMKRRPPERPAPQVFRRLWIAAAVAAAGTSLVMARQVNELQSTCRLMARDFYGALRISEVHSYDGSESLRMLRHGNVIHGEQYLNPVRRRKPTGYYASASGASLALLREPRPPNQKVGIIGLGTGSLAVFGRPGDRYRFYEIDPLVVELARSEFFYLSDSPASVEVVLGDARLSLEREPDQGFDVLLVDAFFGDAIPTHLLTREAFAVYRRHLKPGGTLAVHVTNKYLDLAPVVARGAADLGLSALSVEALPDEAHPWRTSTWVLVAADPGVFTLQPGRNVGIRLTPDPARRPWTDDDTNLLGVLRR